MSAKSVHLFDAHPRKGWLAAERTGSIITHHRLEARSTDPEGARAEAQARWPEATIVLPGDIAPVPAERVAPRLVGGTDVDAIPAPTRRMLESVGLA